MKIINPLQMNDWKIRKFLTIILAIQFAMWGAIGLDAIGLQIPILRPLIGIIYLTFIPGIIILRILKLHKLGNIETVLYAVGLSIATFMFTGLFMNTFYPFFGISRPISITSLIITLNIIVLILCVVSYIIDKDFSAPSFINIKDILSPPALFLCLIPFLSIFGTYFVNFYQDNSLLMYLIIIIALIVVLIGFDKFIPKNLYALAVFVIAVSFVFYRSLISMYISGFDIHEEYYIANLIITNGTWNSTTAANVNAVLSTTMFAPISSNISGMSLTWVFKIIYPFLLSLVPLGLYRVFQKQTNDKIAFFACFFFISVHNFYTDLPVMARQITATLFVILLILLIIDKNMNKMKCTFLSVVFSFSLVVSHYGLTYIYMLFFISAWLILFLAEKPEMQKLKNCFYSRFSKYKSGKLVNNLISSTTKERTIRSTFVLLFVVSALAWYMYISSSSVFDYLAQYVDYISSNIVRDLSNPSVIPGLQAWIAKTKLQLLLELVRLSVNRLAQIFVIIGMIVLLFKPGELKFEKEYAVFSILNLIMYLATIPPPLGLPPLSLPGVDILRIGHITLIILAPFFVIGGMTVFRITSRMIRAVLRHNNIGSSVILSVFFVILFLNETGFVWEVTGGYSGSITLGQEYAMKSDYPEIKAALYNALTVEQDVSSAEWLSRMKSAGKVYATFDDIRVHPLTSYGMIPIENTIRLTKKTKTIQDDSYVYLQHLNVIEDIGTEFDASSLQGKGHSIFNMTEISYLFDIKNKIYSNGGSEIYK